MCRERGVFACPNGRRLEENARTALHGGRAGAVASLPGQTRTDSNAISVTLKINVR